MTIFKHTQKYIEKNAMKFWVFIAQHQQLHSVDLNHQFFHFVSRFRENFELDSN